VRALNLVSQLPIGDRSPIDVRASCWASSTVVAAPASESHTEGFGPLSKTFLAAHFELQGKTGEMQMWSRTRS
jgi:hypothetical protein